MLKQNLVDKLRIKQPRKVEAVQVIIIFYINNTQIIKNARENLYDNTETSSAQNKNYVETQNEDYVSIA